MSVPPERLYRDIEEAFDHFNEHLFEDMLKTPLFTLQRKGNTLGYYSKDEFRNSEDEKVDEIALNPKYFESQTDVGVLCILVHEMAHLRQRHFGKPGRTGYHNREWAQKMIEIGLCPSHTGKPGGRQTGYKMSDYIIDGGPFDSVANTLLNSGFKFSWVEISEESFDHIPVTSKLSKSDSDRSNRWKYTCIVCKSNAWAKPKFGLICAECEAPMLKNEN